MAYRGAGAGHGAQKQEQHMAFRGAGAGHGAQKQEQHDTPFLHYATTRLAHGKKAGAAWHAPLRPRTAHRHSPQPGWPTAPSYKQHGASPCALQLHNATHHDQAGPQHRKQHTQTFWSSTMHTLAPTDRTVSLTTTKLARTACMDCCMRSAVFMSGSRSTQDLHSWPLKSSSLSNSSLRTCKG